MMPRISAALITRNEERYIKACLQSIRDIVDEIVVVDTGSTDKTVSIAGEFNARRFFFPWQDNFATARNEALKHCRGEWILYIDADERLEDTDRNQLLPFLDDKTKVAFTVKFYPGKGFTAYREYRIFRNDPRIRYTGVIHETMFPAIRSVAESQGLTIGKIPASIRHYGYDTDQGAKYRRNLPLLRNEVKTRPDYSFLWWHLGTILMALGRENEAVNAWEEGLSRIRTLKKLTPHDSLIYGELIRLYHVRGYGVLSLIDEALQQFPDQYYILWLKAMVLKDQHDYDAAVQIFKQILAIDPGLLDDPIAYNADIFEALSLEPLGGCYFKLNRLEESADCYRRCEAANPSTLKYKIKRQFIESRL